MIKFFSELPGKMQAWLLQAIMNVIAWGTQTYETAVQWVSDTVAAVLAFFAGLPAAIWQWLVQVVTNVVTWGAALS